MSVFTHILLNNILPIFIIITLGYILNLNFDLSIYTIAKLNLYIFTPAFAFVNLYTAELDFTLLKVLIFCVVYLIINSILADVISKIKHFDSGMSNAFKNSIIFNNTGNIGLSLITLVFSSGAYLIDGQTPYLNNAVAVIVIILIFSNISLNTLGFYFAGRATMSFSRSIRKIFSLPSIYMIPLAFLLKGLEIDITGTFLWPSLNYLKNGMVSMALIALGVQLSQTKIQINDSNVYLSVFIRLIVGPVIAVMLIKMFGFTGIVAQTVLISYSVPTAVNTAIIAVECNNCLGFSTQSVVGSTIFSAFTLTFVIFVAKMIFPI
ncbi:MAG: AEC family transporter [Tissierellales bacterium]|jgi:malate permease and related proteins|nr:AEC family transporter [Tissierellales bacterium]MBN2828284.1 AEC family transporter [Tissierellales bacterium]